MIQELFKFVIQKLKMVFSGLQRLLAPQLILARIKTILRKVLDKIFHIRPRDKDDYYSVGRFLVSRRLVSMVIFLMGIVGAYYLIVVRAGVFSGGANDVKIYNYDSIRLRFADDTVKIRTESGYIGYYGDVSKGKANGKGILYSAKDIMRYSGAFKDSEYCGNGMLYGDNSNLMYSGEFAHNEFQGKGTLYRENGSKEYTGDFDDGKKSGNGKLYDSANNEIYKGNFLGDEINYNELLGKSTTEISDIYTGKRTIYSKDDEFVVNMEDIDTYYVGNSSTNTLDDEVMVNEIYVKKNECVINGERVDSITDIRNLLGNVGFEGKSYITLKEAVVLDKFTKAEGSLDDAVLVKDYEKNKELYLTMFECDDLQYTFYSTDKSDTFIMYSVEE